jgi:hypothetical protein
VALIAAWKARDSSAAHGLVDRVAGKVARMAGRVVPDRLAHRAIRGLYTMADRAAGPGNPTLLALGDRSLEQCDPMVKRVGRRAHGLSLVGGLATAPGGSLTIALDVLLLYALAIWAILKIGRCYGYRLEGPEERAFVLGVLIAAVTESRKRKRQLALERWKDVGETMLTEAQEHLVIEESASLLVRLEAFGAVPGIGTIVICVLHFRLIQRVERAARFAFQERRLREEGKVVVIEPGVAFRPERMPRGAGRHAIYRAAFTLILPIALMGASLAQIRKPPRRVTRRRGEMRCLRSSR